MRLLWIFVAAAFLTGNTFAGKKRFSIMGALKSGDTTAVDTYIKEGDSEDDQKYRAGQALVAAARLGKTNLCLRYLEAGADIKKRGGSALWQAMDKGYPDTAKLLISRGADITPYNYGALKAAVDRNYTGFLQELSNQGTLTSKIKNELLKHAIESGNARMVPHLLRLGADPYDDYAGHGHLLFSIAFTSNSGPKRNRGAVIQALMDAGIDINRRNAKGYTSLMVAVSQRRREDIARYLEHGANPLVGYSEIVYQKRLKGDLWDLYLNSCLEYAAEDLESLRKVEDTPTIKALLSSGEPSERVRKFRVETAFGLAIDAGHAGVAKYLLDQGASATAPNHEGLTPLRRAIKSGNAQIVQMLVAAGADVNENSSGDFPVVMATQQGNAKILSALLAGKPDLSKAGFLALNAAYEKKSAPCIEALLKAGVNPNDPVRFLRLARLQKAPGDVIAALENAGATEFSDAEIKKNREKARRDAARGMIPTLAVAAILGLLLGPIGLIATLKARATMKWPKVKGRVLVSEVRTKIKRRRNRTRRFYVPYVEYEYNAEDSTRKGDTLYVGHMNSNIRSFAQRIIDRYPVGKEVDVYHNPSDLDDCVLEPGRTHPVMSCLTVGLGIGILAATALVVAIIMK